MEQKKKGQVQFNPPAVQLTAQLPEDEAMRDELHKMKLSDGFEESCGPEEAKQKKTHSEKLRYENADKIYE